MADCFDCWEDWRENNENNDNFFITLWIEWQKKER